MYGIFAFFLRQSLIQRWGTMRSLHKENVLEHSAIVSFLCFCLAHVAKQSGRTINVEMLLFSGTIHDVGECICGDVITPVKYANPLLHREIHAVEQTAIQTILKTVPPQLKTVFEDAVCITGYEAKLLKAADTYAAFIKCLLEVESGNAREFTDAKDLLRAQVERQIEICPELGVIDEWFTASVSKSIDALCDDIKANSQG